ncbi:MAG: hypothetical protein KGY55_03265 [Candidatus Thermoplasmatota archaeon]|nr:hypothetical protein [Candidatus Thermoplasmatota archaeon]
MSLPTDILAKRVKNEIGECKQEFEHFFNVSGAGLDTFPVTIKVTLVNTPGPVMKDGQLKSRYNHKLQVTITEDYPYQTPIARWRSTIFHPNIMPPRDGGYICTKLLDEWNFRSNLPSFIRGIESLLLNPNPGDPYDNDTCTRAAEYFHTHPYNPPTVEPSRKSHKKPVIISNNDKDNQGNEKKS